RHDARAQDRGLAQPGLAEQDGEELALDAACELCHLFVAAIEITAHLLGERGEPEPRMLRIDRRLRRGAVGWCHGVLSAGDEGDRTLGAHVLALRHPCRAERSSCKRRANSGETSPPGSRVKCSALNRSGTCALPASVSSMHTGRMKSAPSAILRARSSAELHSRR